jgi:GTPase Era involved in 16S rRNA processing
MVFDVNGYTVARVSKQWKQLIDNHPSLFNHVLIEKQSSINMIINKSGRRMKTITITIRRP